MGKKLYVLDFAVYRWRYSLGYIAVSVLFIALLIIAGLFIPDGLSSAERQSSLESSNLSLQQFTPEMLINLPYHALQKLSFSLFGVHTLSIKLPSLFLSFIAAIGMLLLLKKWFKKNTAILTALLAITTGPFLLIAQSGTPAVLYIFWPTWILLAASELSNKARFPLFWKIVLFGSVALSLYTPLGIYILVALVLASMFHPHLRYTISSLPKLKLLLALFVGIILVAPVAYSIIKQPTVGMSLLGIPSSIDISANIHQLVGQYLNFADPKNGILMTPIYEFATILVALLGLYRVITTKYTARSYVVIAWLIMIMAITLISPSLVAVTFVPTLLLIGFGIDHLIRSWYRLFPRNPYARVAGLIPLVIFIASLTISGVDRFVYGYMYDPSTAAAYSKDLSLLSQERKSHQNEPATLLVTTEEQPFYLLAQRYNTSWNIQNVVHQSSPNLSETTLLIATHSATKPDVVPYKIVAGSRTVDADRFYLYKNDSN